MQSTSIKLFAAATVGLMLVFAALYWTEKPVPPPRAVRKVNSAAKSSEATLAKVSRPANAHPDVKYVGDATCAKCHAELAERYRKHGMGRSLAPIDQAEPIERLDETGGNPFDADGFRYRVVAENGHVSHVETRLGADGQPLVEVKAEIAFAVGSGSQGRSYVVNRSGRLFMSPITWYPRRQKFDLSPGYEKKNSHFERPVIGSCLFCHANQADFDEQSLNKFKGEIFRGWSIGCERCHGPGALHVAKHEAASEAGADDTIVNPRRLAPKLREAVCEQCHLSGVERIVRREHATFDYRPGLPLDEFLSVFVKRTRTAADSDFVGHVEQMHDSRCFQQSSGAMGCISCHDPHGKPAPDEKAAYFQKRCLACHEKQPCSLPAAERVAAQDDCVKCHMPAIATEIRHTANTDHRIPRRPKAAASAANNAAPIPATVQEEFPLVHFHQRAWPEPPAVARREIDRDLAIALAKVFDTAPEIAKQVDGRAMLVLQEAAARDFPSDVVAIETLAVGRFMEGKTKEAVRIFDFLLAEHPQRDFLVEGAATMARNQNDLRAAVKLWQRAIELNPTFLKYHLELCICFATLHEWDSCVAAARRVLELQPANPGARQLLVEGLLGQREFDEANREFALLLRLEPKNAPDIQAWFDHHPLRKLP